jgi:hypothetical protein
MSMMHLQGASPGIPGSGNTDRRRAEVGVRRRGWVVPVRGLAASLVLLAAGCLFSTRTPESPSVNEVPWIIPDTPAKALTNVQVTFGAKSVANYDRSLDSDFTFIPSEADLALVTGSDPTFYDGWNKNREVAAFTSVFQQSDGTVTFNWGPPIPPETGMLTDDADTRGGKYYENLKYRMVFRKTGADTTISGLVNLYLRQETAGWSIYKWIDKQDGLGNGSLGLVRWRGKVAY